jgi:multiple sugar transport system permease protein
MVMPLLLGLLVFAVYPLVYLLLLSVSESTLGQPFRGWVGFGNYAQAFGDGVYTSSLWRSVLFAVPASLVELVAGVAIALLLDASARRGDVMRALILLPLMTPPVMAAVVWRLLLAPAGGLINGFLEGLGFVDAPIPFLAESPWAFLSIVVADAWQWTPFVVLLAYAALQTVPQDVYEAAQVDGASRLSIFRSITLPMILPALLAVELLRLIIAFKVFDLIFVLTSGGPGFDTTTGTFLIWRTALQEFDVGYGAAQTILFALLVGLVILPFVKLREWAERRLT